MNNKATCKNCNSDFFGSYCNNCGQRKSVNKVTFSEISQDFIDTVFSVNAPLWVTIKALFLNPGKLFREYLAGKRKAFYKPVAFFVLITIAYIILFSLYDFDVNNPSQERELKLIAQAEQSAFRNFNNLLFIYVFNLGFTIKLFFYKNYSLIEYITISFYIIGVYTLLLSVTTPIAYLGDFSLFMIPTVLMVLYLIYSFTSFFNKRDFFTIIKIIVAFAISTVLFFPMAFAISLLIVWLKTI
ncbi:DUF3667 domain-containing protein [Ichthyenterobacterium sp. W332]|uniref:DUF3667 domain-containing protein n=1 Tax=Microcosmobacter mediterraneus TaxID=3075607 RepID=A0ABU2YLC2_9FLAO|nr:DUF3667 domain-containing protein [Ichthyenterobacterium sp. W332]MDT0558967.1 DUF3667 domain-containing protein [Ichthyenterobacterium sp. W332]